MGRSGPKAIQDEQLRRRRHATDRARVGHCTEQPPEFCHGPGAAELMRRSGADANRPATHRRCALTQFSLSPENGRPLWNAHRYPSLSEPLHLNPRPMRHRETDSRLRSLSGASRHWTLEVSNTVGLPESGRRRDRRIKSSDALSVAARAVGSVRSTLGNEMHDWPPRASRATPCAPNRTASTKWKALAE